MSITNSERAISVTVQVDRSPHGRTKLHGDGFPVLVRRRQFFLDSGIAQCYYEVLREKGGIGSLAQLGRAPDS